MRNNTILPLAMQDDSNLILEKCINKAFNISLAPIMTALTDTLSKNILFLKAQQLSLTDGDGWQYCTTEDEKRDLLKKSLMIHKFKATKKCIQDLINKSGTTIKLSDWYEYDGINNHYKLECETDKLDDIENLLKKIEQNKRLTAKLDNLIYNLTQEIQNKFIYTPLIGETITIDFDK